MKISYFQNAASLVLLFFFISLKSVSACSYTGYPKPPLSYIFSKTESVFIGKVTNVTIVTQEDEGENYNVQYIQFKIEKLFKGNLSSRTEVILSEKVNKTSCDEPMKRLDTGKTYIVFDEVNTPPENTYILHSTRVTEYDSIKDREYVFKLEKFSKSKETVIHGQIDFSDDGGMGLPLENLEISVKGTNFFYSTKTDKEGNFAVSVPIAGTYKVSFYTPFSAEDFMSYSSTRNVFDKEKNNYFFEYNVTIDQNSEEYRYFFLIKTEK